MIDDEADEPRSSSPIATKSLLRLARSDQEFSFQAHLSLSRGIPIHPIPALLIEPRSPSPVIVLLDTSLILLYLSLRRAKSRWPDSTDDHISRFATERLIEALVLVKGIHCSIRSGVRFPSFIRSSLPNLKRDTFRSGVCFSSLSSHSCWEFAFLNSFQAPNSPNFLQVTQGIYFIIFQLFQILPTSPLPILP